MTSYPFPLRLPMCCGSRPEYPTCWTRWSPGGHSSSCQSMEAGSCPVRYSVQLPTVNAEPKRYVLLSDENNVACQRAGRRFNYTVLFHFGYLLVDGLKVSEWMSPKRLPNRAMFTAVDSVFNERRSAYVVLPFGEDGLILLQKLLRLSSLLFGRLIRQTVHYLLNYVYFLFRLGCSLTAFFWFDNFCVLQLSQSCAFFQHLLSVIHINYSDVQLWKLSRKNTRLLYMRLRFGIFRLSVTVSNGWAVVVLRRTRTGTIVSCFGCETISLSA